MTLHRLEPGEGAVYGAYSYEVAPALTIEPGDTVRFRTLDAGWNLEPWDEECNPGRKYPRNRNRDRGHALTGPVAIRRAQPGMTLAVRLGAIIPAGWGWSSGGGGPWGLNRELNTLEGPEVRMRWEIDRQAMTAANQFGHRIRIKPFLGNLGMPPADPGFHSTGPPRPHGGNIDCKELVAGSHLMMPRAYTPAGWITFGFHENLDVAMEQAVNGMLDLMEQLYGLSRNAALALGTAVVDLRITQVINGVRGVHAILPHDAIESSSTTTTPGSTVRDMRDL